MKEATVLLYIVTLMASVIHIETSSFIVNKRNIVSNVNPKIITFNKTVDLIVKAATCHPVWNACKNGKKCIRDSNDRIYKCRLVNNNNTDGNNSNNNEMNTNVTIANNNTDDIKNITNSNSSSDAIDASIINNSNTSSSNISITDNNESYSNNSNGIIIINNNNSSNSSKNDNTNKSTTVSIINDSSNNNRNESNHNDGSFNPKIITFNKTVDLIVKAATCHPLWKACKNGKKCIREGNGRIYKCRMVNNNNTDDNNNNSNNTTNNNGTSESPTVSPKICTVNSTHCGSDETCVKYNNSLQCRKLSDGEQYMCDLCANGICVLGNDGDMYCSCKPQWTGDLCTEPCHRNCTIGNCILLRYEEYCECPGNFTPSSNCTEQYKEEKLYDVFISYKSSDADENWVKNILFPKIEDDMGLKACVHFRDFVPGETISNNIIESIQNSRRTLLVLTNDYIDSEWTRMEYQVAQQEMFKLRHRIIPVILGNFKDLDIKDKNLKFILETVTYLQWPSDSEGTHLQTAFWNNLKKTLRNKYQSKQVST
ncbi:probable serine/threonine-protein kinase DDB_G0272254 isoform X2 [Octopus sinensis]|uniref:Probable serine/threonine-protein kinase DDB_G0272254 isoform X2 n=1 Tax=Octopus sinensis TaxID=2607531 RepID=A0A7E6F2X1_9MOLL|nr:probable serine/threonine-protein kinase DDB_G0272254 isoform X2 [Octopus sinensis]